MEANEIVKRFLEVMKTDESYVSKYIPEKSEIQKKTKQLVFEYNHTSPDDEEKRREILGEILGKKDNSLCVETGFNCDYGFNIKPKGFAFINYNCTILDTSPVYIGDRVFIAPGVVISCAAHAVHPEERFIYDNSSPIYIGDDVWIGANATIIGGVHIGNGSIIGAGSVVNKDIPEGVVAAGVPCKVIRKITEKDKIDISQQMII